MTSTRKSGVPLTRILFATDFSEVSAKALPYAAAFARQFSAELCVVHVPGSDEAANGADAVQLRRDTEARTHRLLEAAHYRAVEPQIVIAEGEILPALASVAEERGSDLLVLGMHGRHGISRALLGSVAGEVLRLAEIPVLVVGPEVTVPPEEEMTLRRVLYAVDFSPDGGRALRYAAAMASAEGARLLVLHVVEDIWKEPASTRLGREEYLRLRLLETGWQAAIDPLQPELLIDFGPAEDRIVQQAERHRVGLIVLDVPTSNHPVLSSHLPGPIAYNVASHARCPVLAVRGSLHPAA